MGNDSHSERSPNYRPNVFHSSNNWYIARIMSRVGRQRGAQEATETASLYTGGCNNNNWRHKLIPLGSVGLSMRRHFNDVIVIDGPGHNRRRPDIFQAALTEKSSPTTAVFDSLAVHPHLGATEASRPLLHSGEPGCGVSLPRARRWTTGWGAGGGVSGRTHLAK